jgi:catechol 2,3-dioxygenase
MEIKELGHLVLYVRDVDRSAAFYRDVLGWRQILPDPTAPAPASSRIPAAAFSAGRTLRIARHRGSVPPAGRHLRTA